MIAGPRSDLRGRPADRRPARQRRRSGRSRHCHRVPELRALPAHDRRQEPGLRPQAPRHVAAAEIETPHQPGRGTARHRAAAGAQALATLRRPAPARRARPGTGARAARPSCSTSRCPTSTRRCAASMRTELIKLHHTSGHHHRPRHPRSGRGDDHGRAHLHHEGWRHRSGRRADGGLSQSGQHLRRELSGHPADEPPARPHRGRRSGRSRGRGSAQPGCPSPRRSRRPMPATPARP